MMFNKIQILSIIFILILGNLKTNAQKNTDCYEYLTLKEFMETKIKSDTSFVRQIYTNVKYPKVARKNEIEGKIEIILISHKNKKFEVIVLNQPLLFFNLESEIQKALTSLNVNQKIPFLTRFYIIFSLDKLRYPREKYKQFHLGLYNDNTFNIVEYIVPEIYHH